MKKLQLLIVGVPAAVAIGYLILTREAPQSPAPAPNMSASAGATSAGTQPSTAQGGAAVGTSATGGGNAATNSAAANSATPRSPTSRGLPAADLSAETNLPTERLKRIFQQQAIAYDPRANGWLSEFVAEQVETQLAQVGKGIQQLDEENREQLNRLVASQCQVQELRPERMTVVWDRHGLTVRQASDGAATFLTGPRALVEAIARAFGPERGERVLWTKFKIVSVQISSAARADTVSYFQAAAVKEGAALQFNATWRCRWLLYDAKTPPQLEKLEVEGFSETRCDYPTRTMFSDCTLAAAGANESFTQQLSRGLNYWVQRIDTSYRTSIAERYGVAVGDVNGDGLEDVYVCQPSGLPNRLLIHEPSGAVVDKSAECGVDFLDHTPAALFVDLDNDGDQDLVTCHIYRLLFLKNDGQGHFTIGAEIPIREWDVHGLSAIDVNNDGYLDVFLCVDTAEKNDPQFFVYFDARDGGANFLFRNDIGRAEGTWRFVDITEEAGLGRNNYRHSLAASWEDYDNDGDPDLYIANDYGVNNLFRNDGGQFVDVAEEAGVLDPGSGMSVSWGDYDRDGLYDLYVGNMFSSAGSRVTTQEARLAKWGPQKLALLQRFAKGNSLFQNAGGGKFRDTGKAAGVEMGRWAWSSLFADLNNDGWEDIYVANGYITNNKLDDL